MVGAPAQHTRAEPVKLGFIFGGIRLAFQVPAAKSAVKVAKVPGIGA